MIPPSSPAFLAERQSIFAQGKTQPQLENIKCWRIYIACGHPVPARRARQLSSPAIPKAAEGQPVLRYVSLRQSSVYSREKNPTLSVSTVSFQMSGAIAEEG